MKISMTHSNRLAHNWLAYDIGDRSLVKHAAQIKGVAYDLGAGESPYKDFFGKCADRYITVDWSNSYHETRVDIVADLNKALPIESAIADTVMSLSVLEHLCEPQIMLREACRILKPGGVLLLQVPWQWWIHEAPYDYFRYTPYGLKYLLGNAGFSDVVVEAQCGFFSMLILKLNYFTRRLIRGPRILQWLLNLMFLPFWFIGQTVAPLLDKLDRNWALEAAGYFVIAKKPYAQK